MIAVAKHAPTSKERGILFRGPMVRAILDGRKTQTRRPVKVHVDAGSHSPYVAASTSPTHPALWRWRTADGGAAHTCACPYGQVGDRLWVRETWGIDSYRMLAGIPKTAPDWLEHDGGVLYRADGECCDPLWLPSIHMPRWASRITLEIVGVRAARLHSISEDDARAEGVIWGDVVNRGGMSFRDGFRHLWSDMDCGASWDANPWVWVVSFRPLEVP